LRPNPDHGPRPRKGDAIRSVEEDIELVDPHGAGMTVIRCVGGHAWISWTYGDDEALRYQCRAHVRIYHGGKRTVFWLYAADPRMGLVVGGPTP